MASADWEWLVIGAVLYAIMSVVTFIVFVVDKCLAIHERYRVPERTLFMLAFFGGCPGAGLGMLVAWHKVRKPAFVRGIPAIGILHLLILIALLVFYYTQHSDDSDNSQLRHNQTRLASTVAAVIAN